jgi:integrase
MPLQALKELRIEGWRSDYRSVDNVLRHLRRKTGSYASVEVYAEVLSRFCSFVGCDPDQLLSLGKRLIESNIHTFLDSMRDRGLSLKTISTRRSYLMLHFRVNGFKGDRALDVEVYHVPPRYRKLPEYVPSAEEIFKMANAAASLRDRAIILCLYTSGLREATFKALRYCDVKGDLNSQVIFVPVYPEMKQIHSKACKNSIPYYTFFNAEASEALRAYLRDREAKYGPLQDSEILFTPSPREARLPPEKAKFKTLSKNGLNRILKRAAKNAGIKEWMHIHPHCFRKAFERVLRSRRIDGTIMDTKTQEFLMGHILPGSQDPYFGSGIRVEGSTISFDKNKVDELRVEYSKLVFAPEAPPTRKELVLEAIRRFAESFGIDPMKVRIEKKKELGREPEAEEEIQAIQNEIKKMRSGNDDPKEIVSEDELERYLAEGWDVQTVLPSGKILIRRAT